MPAWMAPRLAPPESTKAVVMVLLPRPGRRPTRWTAASAWASPLPAAAAVGRGGGVGARETRQRQRAEQETEVPERDVAVAAHEQQAGDDSAEPGGHEDAAEARRERHSQAGRDLDDPDH